MQAPPVYPGCTLPSSLGGYSHLPEYRYSQYHWQCVSSGFNPQLVSPLPAPPPPTTHYNQGKSGGKDGEEKKEGGEWEQYNAGAAFLGPTLWDKTLTYDSDLKVSVHESVPGQDFDPRTRCFSEEELKPQPMIKKSRKQFVPQELKDDRYWARRRKNNMAAKRSRDARRLKENQIAMRANFLEKENNALTAELQKAQAVMESLKKRLAIYEAV